MIEEIEKLIEKEVNVRVSSKLTAFLEYVSQAYDVSLNMLLKDLNNIDSLEVEETFSEENRCSGLTAKGKRCPFKGKFNGYCKKHKREERPRQREVAPSYQCQPIERVTHNHSIPPMYKEDCPACKSFKTTAPDLLIEM